MMSAYGTMDDMCAENVEDMVEDGLLPNAKLTAEEIIKARRHGYQDRLHRSEKCD